MQVSVGRVVKHFARRPWALWLVLRMARPANKGQRLYNAGEFSRAIPHLDRAVRVAERVSNSYGGRYDEVVLMFCGELERCYREIGDETSAQLIHDRASALRGRKRLTRTQKSRDQ